MTFRFRQLLLALLTTAGLGLLCHSDQPNSATAAQGLGSVSSNRSRKINQLAQTGSLQFLWSNRFQSADWQSQWQVHSQGSWGMQNLRVLSEPQGKHVKFLRTFYPKGSASPTVTRQQGAPVGGGQFYASLGITPRHALRLSYAVRFSSNFDFVKGGKLPGLFGGTATSGGTIPNGTNGVSTRYMWRHNGSGEVYAYLPGASDYGVSIGRGNWQFIPGRWHQITQEVVLNQPNQQDGRIRVWFDGKLVLDERNLLFRTSDRLKLEGIFFSTFFGGNDASWASRRDVTVDFADFKVWAIQ